MTERAFYTVADTRFFLGVVGLVNSLRSQGHDEPIVVVDCGFRAAERDALSNEVTIIEPPEETFPMLAWAFGPLQLPAAQMIVLDADIIALRSLAELFGEAATGRMAVFEDPVAHRFDARWTGLLGLPPSSEQPPYVNAGLIALPESRLPLLEEFARLRVRLDLARSAWNGGSPSDPFFYLDQDLLNALLGARVSRSEIAVLPSRLAPHPPFRGLRRSTAGRLAYADGVEPFVLHYAHPRKPWFAHARQTPYSRMLRELVRPGGLAVRPPAGTVPLRLREGPASAAARAYSTGRGVIADNRGRLGVRRRLAVAAAARRQTLSEDA